MSGSRSPVQAGRPKDGTKNALIIQAAQTAFFSQGYAHTTIEGVAEAAGVSKVTVYGHFLDKAGLFEAVVRGVASRIEADIARYVGTSDDLADQLIGFGRALMSQVMSSEMLTFEQRLAGDLAALPDLAQRFFDAGPGKVRQRLADILQTASEAGALTIDDPLLAAADLMGLWQGFTPVEVKFGIANPPTVAEMNLRVARGVHLFLKAYKKE